MNNLVTFVFILFTHDIICANQHSFRFNNEVGTGFLKYSNWNITNKSSLIKLKNEDRIHLNSNKITTEPLETIFMFNVAHKLREGRSLLSISAFPVSKQKTCLDHFVGYFGDSCEDILQNTFKYAVQEYEKNASTINECVDKIKDVFISSINNQFTSVENLDDDLALDRQLYLLYSADLMASYILLFTGKITRVQLYKYIWYNWAFVDGDIDWLCCNWVLNRNKHDEEVHKNIIAVNDISSDELIDVIRLHKHHLSSDFVKQRSRNVLSSLDRTGLSSIFQSIMIKILWGNKVTSEYADDVVTPKPTSKKKLMLDESVDGDEHKEEEAVDPTTLSTLTSWMKEYRRRRPYKQHMRLPKSAKLDFEESQYITQMKSSLKRVNEQLESFKRITMGMRNDLPLSEAFNVNFSGVPNVANKNITVGNVKETLRTLIDFYESNLSCTSELYGHINNQHGINLMKFLLTKYDKSELMTILSASLMALPELKPISTKQDYATYSMLPYNTIVKLTYIAIMRINPRYSEEVDSSETTSGECEQEVESEIEGDDSSSITSHNAISAMVFEMRELVSVLANNRSGLITNNLMIGNEVKPCIIMLTERKRKILEGIMLHLSNYDLIFDTLENYDLEKVDESSNKTVEVIRRIKLSNILKNMSDDEFMKFYDEILRKIDMRPSINLPEELFEVNESDISDDLNLKPDEDIYCKIVDLLERHEFQTDDVDTTESHEDSSDILSERENILNLLEGVDLTSYLDPSFSNRSVDEMTTSELKIIAERVIENMKNEPDCDYIVIDSNFKNPFNLNMYKGKGCMVGANNSMRHGSNKIFNVYTTFRPSPFHLSALPELLSSNVPLCNQSYEFSPRSQLNFEPTWQDPHLMECNTRFFNRVDMIDIEGHVKEWMDLGLGREVSNAAVAWIKKSILDIVSNANARDLEIVPTEIQKKVIPEILKSRSKNILIASNAASGKTLSYLLPIIKLMKDDEKTFLRRIQAPKALIIVPNRELAHQVLSVMKGLSHVVKFKSESIAGGFLRKKQRKQILDTLVDVVICTPERLAKMYKYINLRRLKHVILDEADTLLNEGFWPQIQPILDMLHEDVKTILVSSCDNFLEYFKKTQETMMNRASYNRSVVGSGNKKRDELNKRMEEYYGDIDYEKSRRGFKLVEDLYNSNAIVDDVWLNRPCRGVTHEFIELKGQDKVLALINLIKYQKISKCKKILVFCNTIQSCRAIEYHLTEAGLPATSLHGKVPILQRRKNYLDFINKTTGIMVCSDIVSRGLDFYADAVVMFDFPLNSMDYLRRCGRVGRVINNDLIAPKGYAVSLLKKRDMPLATAIQRSIKMPFFPLHKLSSRKSDYNHLTGRLQYLTQSGAYFKLAKLLREFDIKGTFSYYKMDKYLEIFKRMVKEQKSNSLKKIMLRRRKICKRRRILLRRLKLTKRWNKAVRLKQRIIAKLDKTRYKHVILKNDARKCAPMKNLRPIRGKLMQLKTQLKDMLNERKVKRNAKAILKFINKIQKIAKSNNERGAYTEDAEEIKFRFLNEIKTTIGKKVKHICSLV